MISLRNMSIRWKQMLIILLTSSAALFLACATFVAVDAFTFRQDTVDRITSLAEAVGANCAAAMDFDDAKVATETLEMMRGDREVVFGCLYDRRGKPFASAYKRDGESTPFVAPPAVQRAGKVFENNHLRLFHPIIQQGQEIGTIYIVTELKELSRRVVRYTSIVGLVFAASLLLALVLSNRLQRLVSDPILHLAHVARSVAVDKNYSVRATRQSGDELGELITGFNEMLSEIQKRDAALLAARDQLEQRVEERTRELAGSLSLLNATLESTVDGILVVDLAGKVTSFNRKFVEMWGLTPEVMAPGDDRRMLETVIPQLNHPEAFLRKTQALYEHPEQEGLDTVEFKDGRVFERYSQAQLLDGKCVGRVWCFREITERLHAETRLEEAHRDLVRASRQAGMAEVATGVLHNIGNVLNSVNVSATIVANHIQESRVDRLVASIGLLQDHEADLAAFLARDPKGQRIIPYLGKLVRHFEEEQAVLLKEIEALTRNVEHIKQIVSVQQNYAKVSGVTEKVSLSGLIEDALQVNQLGLERHGIRVVREFEPLPPVLSDKHKLLQILLNLIRNAKEAIKLGENPDRTIWLRVQSQPSRRARIQVQDSGVGIKPEHLTRIFSHGFTTKRDGHGFGLHLGALAARQMGGSLTADSAGPGLGSTFTLDLPLRVEDVTVSQSPMEVVT